MENSVDHSLVTMVREVPAFADLEDDALLELIGISANLFWPGGSLVFEKGSDPDGLYFVLSGRVGVSDPDADGSVVEVGAGDFFGELSLLLGVPRTRRVEALEDTELLVLPADSFGELMDSIPDLAARCRQRAADLTAGDAAEVVLRS